MDISKRNRGDLKSFFVTNAIPTESNFADLIDGMLNQKEDGIVKPPGSPLCVEAVGDGTSQKRLLNLYESFADESPAWTLSLRPRTEPLDPLSAKSGLSISDAGGSSRLFIDRVSGNVGVGTLEPAARLHVAGALRVDGALEVQSLTTQSGLSIQSGQPVSGVRVIDFKEIQLTRLNMQGNWAVATGAVTFSQPVVSAQVVLKSWEVWFSAGVLEHAIHRIMVVPGCSVSGNTVNVSVTGGLRDSSGTLDDPFSIDVRLLVLAHLQNAV